jgi:ABC-2 type transport system ATP-binding protein
MSSPAPACLNGMTLVWTNKEDAMRVLEAQEGGGGDTVGVARDDRAIRLAGARVGPTAIRAERLVRRFDGLTAVAEIDLDIRRGEIYGFLGPNGAGKSTTVRVLCTLLSPTAGRAVVAGHDVATEPEKVRLRIGAALQEAALDPKQTGIELLRLQGRLYGLSRTDVNERLTQLGRLIDIGDALGRPIETYSGGMKRRLDLAAALVHNPEVLFLDEPTTGLDPVSRSRMWEEVRRLNRELDVTIFLTTQYLEEADELADRVGIIHGGRLVAEGTPEELKRSVGNDVIVARLDGNAGTSRQAVEGLPGVHSVEARGDKMIVTAVDGAATIGAVAVALNEVARVRHLTLRTPTLDDVFLELTGNHIRADEPARGEPTRSELMEVGR